MKKSNRSTSTSNRRQDSLIGALSAYYNKRLDSLKSAAGLAAEYYSVESIHDLRVEVKKIRAFYGLLEWPSGEFNFREDRLAWKKLYRRAGALRDIDIVQAILIELGQEESLAEFYNYLKAAELEKRKKLTETYHRSVLSSTGNFPTVRLQPQKKISAAQFREKLYGELENSIAGLSNKLKERNLDETGLHLIRKECKSLKYMLDVCRRIPNFPRAYSAPEPALKTAYDSLGRWRDLYLAKEFVDSFLSQSKKMSPEKQKYYFKFIENLNLKTAECLTDSTRNNNNLRRTIELAGHKSSGRIKLRSNRKQPPAR